MSELLASLRLDLEYAKRGYRRYAVYPAATIAGVLTNTVFGFMRASVLLALFAQRDVVGGYDVSMTLTYTWLTQGMIMTVFIWGWNDLGVRIRTGDIASDLVRPVDPIRAWLAFDLGRAVYHAAFRGIPPFLIGAIAFRLTIPRDPLVWLAFLVSVVLAVAASYAFRVLYNLGSFWLMDHRGMVLLGGILSSLLTGFIIPISFFPEPLGSIARATPFPSMIQVPVDVFVGATVGNAVVVQILTQLAWAVALLVVARYGFSLGVRRLVVQGG